MTLQLDGKLVLVGAGKMGGALLLGMLEHGLNPKNVTVQDPSPPDEMTATLARFGISPCAEPAIGGAPAEVVLLAVKPQLVGKVLHGIGKTYVGPNTLVISVAAGITLHSLMEHLDGDTATIRAMPNTPAAIGQGMSVCCANANVSDGQRQLCETLLKSVGATAWVDDETQMDAVTAVSGSGPAYVFYLAECLTAAGMSAGLGQELAAQLAIETIAGAGALLKASDEDAATLRKNVTSKGGTTAAALEVLMEGEHGLKALLEKAVAKAAQRSRDLAG